MAVSFTFLAIIAFTAFATPHLSLAQNFPQDFLTSHNAARARDRIGPVTWNATLEKYARNYASVRARDCQLQHSKGPYGENLAKGWGNFSALDAVKLWVDEKPLYNYKSNKCVVGKMCGHYTAVVWRNTKQIGCARVPCNQRSWVFVTCNYYPPGNWVGQRPF